MITEMRLDTEADGRSVIKLTVPSDKLLKIAEVIRNVLKFAGHKVKQISATGEEWIPAEEVFPDASPAMVFRGLRTREDLTQAEMAARLGVSQNAISEMESGKRPISVKMAKRIEEEFKSPYRIFL